MRYATLLRNKSTDDGTFGVLLLDDNSFYATGELPWKNNAKKESCIPPGTYIASMFDSPKHGPSYLLKEVPGRSFIEVHSANFMGDVAKGKANQLLGCIALGNKIGKLAPEDGDDLQTAVLQSKVAVDEFEKNLNNEDLTLTIIQL